MCYYRTADGKCKKHSDAVFTSYCVDGPCPDDKPTNADRIRSMTDGELAEFIDNIAMVTIKGVYCHILGKMGTEKRGCYSDDHQEDCVECALDWLQQPAEEKP